MTQDPNPSDASPEPADADRDAKLRVIQAALLRPSLLMFIGTRHRRAGARHRYFFDLVEAAADLGLVVSHSKGFCMFFGAVEPMTPAQRHQIVNWLIDQPGTRQVVCGDLRGLAQQVTEIERELEQRRSVWRPVCRDRGMDDEIADFVQSLALDACSKHLGSVLWPVPAAPDS